MDGAADGEAVLLDERFTGPELDAAIWLPSYLPQWSSRSQAAARYRFADGGGVVLEIHEDQPPWCPDHDGSTRVSSLQTGVFAGPVGSAVGQHRFRDDLRVREAQETARLFTPRYGRFELRARASADPACMVALWMIGFEDEPSRSAEICVCEIFGRDVGHASAKVGLGVHPFGDPDVVDDFEQVELAIDATEVHAYRADWTPDGVTFTVDGTVVKRSTQSPGYPMQLMLGIYEFRSADGPAGAYPKAFAVERLRAYRPRPAPVAQLDRAADF